MTLKGSFEDFSYSSPSSIFTVDTNKDVVGGEDSIRVVLKCIESSQVSVKSKKSSLYVDIRSLIKKYFFMSDLIFSRASFTMREVAIGAVHRAG